MIILDEQETQHRSSTSSSGLSPPPVIKNSAKADEFISGTPSPVINTTSSPPPPYIQSGPLSPSSPSYPYFNQSTAAHHHYPHHAHHPHSHHAYHPHSHHTYHHTHHHSQPPTPTSPTTTTTVPHTASATSTAVEDHPLVVHYRIQQRDPEKRALIRFFAAFLIALVIVTLSSTFVQLVASAALRSGRQRVHTTAVQGEEVSAVSVDASHRTSVDSTSALIPKERILSIAYPPPR